MKFKLNYTPVFSAEQPADPVTNTLWIKDGVETTNILFRMNDVPESPSENTLCIHQGADSRIPFDVIENSGIRVYPRKIKQYILSNNSYIWQVRNAKFYNGAAWTGLEVPLYDYGDECTSLSGGWTTSNASWSTAGSGITATLTKNSDHMFVTGNSTRVTGGSGYRLTTISTVDLTDIDQIGIEVSSLTGQGMLGVLAAGEEYMNADACVNISGASGTTPVTTTKDVSDLTGKYYVCLLMRCTASKVMTLQAKVHSVWIY